MIVDVNRIGKPEINDPYAAMLAELAAEGYGVGALSEKLGIHRNRVKEIAAKYEIDITKRQRYPSVIRIEREFRMRLPDVLRLLGKQGCNKAEAGRRLDVPGSTVARWCREFGVTLNRKPHYHQKIIVWQGLRMNATQWAERIGISQGSFSRRMKLGLPKAVVMMAGKIPRALTRYNCAILVCAAKVPSGVDKAWLEDTLFKEYGVRAVQLHLQSRLGTLVSLGYLERLYAEDDTAVWRITEKGLKVVTEE